MPSKEQLPTTAWITAEFDAAPGATATQRAEAYRRLVSSVGGNVRGSLIVPNGDFVNVHIPNGKDAMYIAIGMGAQVKENHRVVIYPVTDEFKDSVTGSDLDSPLAAKIAEMIGEYEHGTADIEDLFPEEPISLKQYAAVALDILCGIGN